MTWMQSGFFTLQLPLPSSPRLAATVPGPKDLDLSLTSRCRLTPLDLSICTTYLYYIEPLVASAARTLLLLESDS